MTTEIFSWVERPTVAEIGDPPTAEAACVTVAVGAGEPGVLEALGLDRASAHQATFHEAELEWSEQATPVQVWTSDGKTIIVEPNGYIASLPENLVAVARGGLAVSVFWNVNAQMQVMVVKDGVVARTFDPLLYDDPGPRLPEEDGLAFGHADGGVLAAALAFLERCTGFVASEDAILTQRRPTYSVPAR